MSKKTKRNITPYLALIFVLVVIYFVSTMISNKVHNINYSTFTKKLAKDKVETVEVTSNTKGSIYEITGRLKGYSSKESYYATAPLSDETINFVKNLFSV